VKVPQIIDMRESNCRAMLYIMYINILNLFLKSIAELLVEVMDVVVTRALDREP
jgi:hypothetical protein